MKRLLYLPLGFVLGLLLAAADSKHLGTVAPCQAQAPPIYAQNTGAAETLPRSSPALAWKENP